MHHSFLDISGLWVYKLQFQGVRSWFAHLFCIISNPEVVAGHQGSQGRPALFQCQARHVWTRVSPSRIHEDGKSIAFVQLINYMFIIIIYIYTYYRYTYLFQILNCFTEENIVSVTDGIFLPPCDFAGGSEVRSLGF